MARRALILLLVLAFAATGCGRKKAKVFPDQPIRAQDPVAQESFDAAVELLEARQWDEALDAFRLIQAQHPHDPVAELSEMYAARAELRDLSVLAPEPRQVSSQALSRLAAIADERAVDDRIRYGALVYYASGLTTMGEGTVALAELAEYPSSAVSPVVLEIDRDGAQALIAEALSLKARFSEAVVGFGSLYTSSRDEAVRRYAVARGFEAAAHLKESDLVELGEGESPFVRGVAGWTLIDRRIRVASDEETEALQQLLGRISPDLVTIGEGDRVAPLSETIAARGDAPRLAIGVAVPLTGGAAAVGRRALYGALVASRAFAPGEANTTLVFVDSARADAAEGVAKLRAAGVSAIVGPLDSGLATQWSAAANAAEVPIFTLTTEPLGDSAGDWGFRWFIDASSEARAAARIAVNEQGDARIAVVYPDIGYGRRMAQWFRGEVEAHGGVVTMYEAYDRSSTDFSRLASRVAADAPDAVFIPDTAAKVGEVTAFLAQANVWGIDGRRRPDARQGRVQVHYIGTSLWNDAALLKQAAAYVTGALIPAWASPVFTGDANLRFHEGYAAATGQQPDDVAAFAFDAVSFIRQAFSSGIADPLGIRELARAPRAYRGVSGATRFGSNGEPLRQLRFITVGDGSFQATERAANVGFTDEI